jgi:copper resistance protein C
MRNKLPQRLEQFRNYCVLTKIARCGFPWEKTTKRSITSVYAHCQTALAGVIVFLIAILIAASPRTALAHAVLVSSKPQKNATVSGPDITINLKYNSRVDGGRSALSLLKPDGTVERLGGLTQPLPDVVAVTGHGLAKGAYVLRWQVLSSDGHITRGEVPFQVQ